MPVEANGPDIVSNGLASPEPPMGCLIVALSGWDDMQIMVLCQANDPDSIRSVINATGRILIPLREAGRTHLQFV
jgi:putative restriction endonuclease